MVVSPRGGMGSYPALTALGLEREHLAALARGATCMRSRLARAGATGSSAFGSPAGSVRYVGNHPGFVDQVRRELVRLQAPAKSRRHLRRLVRAANECLRRTRQQLNPLLPLAGRCFHGREIRRQAEDGDACDAGRESFVKNLS